MPAARATALGATRRPGGRDSDAGRHGRRDGRARRPRRGRREAVARARAGEGPTLIVADCYRFEGHHVGDTEVYRTAGRRLALARARPDRRVPRAGWRSRRHLTAEAAGRDRRRGRRRDPGRRRRGRARAAARARRCVHRHLRLTPRRAAADGRAPRPDLRGSAQRGAARGDGARPARVPARRGHRALGHRRRRLRRDPRPRRRVRARARPRHAGVRGGDRRARGRGRDARACARSPRSCTRTS